MQLIRYNTVPPEKIYPLVKDYNSDYFYLGENNGLVRAVYDSTAVTAPLQFGKRLDLLANTRTLKLGETIDPALSIENVYFKVNSVLYAVNVKGEPRNCSIAHLLDDVRRVTVDYTSYHLPIDKALPPFFDNVDTSHIQHGLFQFKITGEIQLSRGIIEINAEVVEQSENIVVEMVGYTLAAYFHSNH